MKAKVIVIKEFRDVYNFSLVHKEGEDVSNFDSKRIKRLVSLGYVKAETSPENATTKGKGRKGTTIKGKGNDKLPEGGEGTLGQEPNGKGEESVAEWLTILGKECVALARNQSLGGNYIDQTGNLRGSIGFVVSKNGEILSSSNFEPVAGKDSRQGTDGPIMGRQFAEQLATEQPLELTSLIVVAGMNYATYVEVVDNKIVLASARLYATDIVSNMKRRQR